MEVGRNHLDILQKLVGFPTVSRNSNRELLEYVGDWLSSYGIRSEILWNEDQRKGNLWATIGPPDRPGVILSGHTDVVPVDGQAWSSDPFTLRGSGERVYGRGSADMKGFIAVALALVPELVRRRLQAPVHLAFRMMRRSAVSACGASSPSWPTCRSNRHCASSASRRACRW